MSVLHNMVHAVSSVFGCQHDRLTRPFTIRNQSYMVCLDCGHEIFYSMDKMRRLNRREVRQLRHSLLETAPPAKAPAASHLTPGHAAPGHAVKDTTIAA